MTDSTAAHDPTSRSAPRPGGSRRSAPNPVPGAVLALALAIEAALPARAAGAEIRPADPAAAPSREEMTGWHRGYEPRAAPVRRALVGVIRARHEPRPGRWEPGVRRSCDRLARELGRFGEGVEAGEIFPVPYRPADYHLKRSYASLDEAARACLAGRYGAMEAAIHDSLASLQQAETVLWRRYRLRP